MPLSNKLLALSLVGSLSLAVAVSAAETTRWKSLAPGDGKSVQVKGGKTTSTYYALDEKKPLVIKVTGPGLLRAYTRVTLAEKQKESVYGIVALRDGSKRYLLSRSAKASKAKIIGREKTRLGAMKSVSFKVPKGEHEYEILLPTDAKSEAYARFAFKEQVKKPAEAEHISYVAYLPRKFGEEVRIIVKEDEYVYYRVTLESNVEVEAIGPTRLKCFSRLEFDQTMHGIKPYRIQVAEGDKVIQTSPFKAKVSAIATYRQTSDKVLGQGDTFYIKVPEGKHRYKISTPDSGVSALLRFYLPEKSLGNEIIPGDQGNGKAELFKSKSQNGRG
jgi:hypothetical protein